MTVTVVMYNDPVFVIAITLILPMVVLVIFRVIGEFLPG